MRITAAQRIHNENASAPPWTGCCAANPTRRQLRYQDARTRGRGRPDRLLRHPALRTPAHRIRAPAAAATGRRNPDPESLRSNAKAEVSKLKPISPRRIRQSTISPTSEAELWPGSCPARRDHSTPRGHPPTAITRLPKRPQSQQSNRTMLTDPTVTSITVDPPLSPHELQSVSRTPHRELPTSAHEPDRTRLLRTQGLRPTPRRRRHSDRRPGRAARSPQLFGDPPLLPHRRDRAAATPSTRSPRSASTGTATGSGDARPDGLRARPPPSARSPSPTAPAPNQPTSRPVAAPAGPVPLRGCDHFRTNIALPATCRHTSTICCAPANDWPPPSTGWTTGPAPTPPPPRRSPGSAG